MSFGDGNMTSATKAKMKYNRSVYKRYEFNVNVDTELNWILEYYKKTNSLSNLVKTLLCDHFKIGIDDIFTPYHLVRQNGEWVKVPNPLIKHY